MCYIIVGITIPKCGETNTQVSLSDLSDLKTIEVEWSANSPNGDNLPKETKKHAHKLNYVLTPPKSPSPGGERIRHSTLASAYRANLQGEPDDLPSDIQRSFILKLPNLQDILSSSSRKQEQIADEANINARLNVAERIFSQEYDLKKRFYPGEPAVLPELLSDKVHGLSGVDSKRPIPYVVRTFVDGETLRDYVTSRYPGGDGLPGSFDGISNIQEWFDLASALLHSLGEMHRERATHGFIYPDSVIIPRKIGSRGCVKPNDKLIFVNAAESQPFVFFPKDAVASKDKLFPVRRWYDAAENLYRYKDESGSWARFELDQGNDYYSTTDIFSLGVTLAFLATGREDLISPFDYVGEWKCGHTGWQIVRGGEVRRKYQVTKTKLLDAIEEAAQKRERQSNQKSAQQIFVESLCQAEVILQCVQPRSESGALSVGHALNTLNLFQPAVAPDPPESIASPSFSDKESWNSDFVNMLVHIASHGNAHRVLDQLAEKVVAKLDLPDKRVLKPFHRLIGRRLASELERITSLDKSGSNRSPSVRVIGSRATLVEAFLTAISALTEDEECLALTGAGIWNDENFGATSRTSSMLQLLRLRGVGFQWVIAIKSSELYTPKVQRVLGFRRADDQRLALIGEGTQGEKKTKDQLQEGYFYACLEDNRYEELFRGRKSFIGVRPKRPSTTDGKRLSVHIAPDFINRGGLLVALTFWNNPRRSPRLIEAFEETRQVARPAIGFDRML